MRDKLKILVCEPEKDPYVTEINDDFREMQRIVGGLIEPIYFEQKSDAQVFCNEEFLLNGSEPNRKVGEVLVHGTFFVVGNGFDKDGEQISVSLTDEQVEKYTNQFWARCMRIGNVGYLYIEPVRDTEITEMDTEAEDIDFDM